MNKSDLKKLTKSQLIKLLLKQEKKKPKIIMVDAKPSPKPRTVKPRRTIPTPRKSVKQMVYDYENNIILPPLEFRDKPIPLPRTKKPVPLPRTKIEQTDKALKGYTKSYEISIKNNRPISAAKQHTKSCCTPHHKCININERTKIH